ncbi:MAG: DNA repair protein RadA [Zetaproteobacteria bacterium]|nr:DNA repair protein RadA [Zetaproteobacteria bacterium]
MKSLFTCNSCGSEHRKWMGQCPDCLAWNSITEESGFTNKTPKSSNIPSLTATAITEVSCEDSPRFSTGIDELNRVLGGGLVPGSAILVGGNPGIGKSTLLLQAASQIAMLLKNSASSERKEVLYITGEESAQQVKLRGQRIDALHPNLLLANSCNLESMLSTIKGSRPSTVIIDSIQTTISDQLTSAAGTVSQVRDCAAALIQQAKQLGHALILVGHVTKDGNLAGPRVLEHMVDAVIYFEGDRGHSHRILRAIKNRYGPAGEIGVFEMRDKGLVGIRDASRLFLAERSADTSGSVVLACLEGTRPLLVEVQALVSPTVYATPKRAAVGLDANRVAMLVAVMERRIGIPLTQHDVYVNVAGGAKITEPAADLAILLAILSAYQDRPLPLQMVVFGEVGLTGEIRPVGNPETRIKEAIHMGFQRVVLPHENFSRVQDLNSGDTLRKNSTSLRSIPIKHLRDAAQKCLERDH